uniref:(California timema) hypothetical protein n=1 Tax=Timema californicum TaxID=61474 RepID=A0A7R9P651_TIMCA|nr:unnamed protein product [Timema californicum]
MLSVLYIKSVDGFTGIYRGLAPKLCSNAISGFTFHKVSDALRRNTDDKSEQYAEDEELSEEQRGNWLSLHRVFGGNWLMMRRRCVQTCLSRGGKKVGESVPATLVMIEQKDVLATLVAMEHEDVPKWGGRVLVSVTRAKFARTLANDIAAQAAAIIASQPFNVIAVRMMAQFVGAEKIYSGVLSSIGHIYHEEGLLGFFSGLMPRLLGELVALVISSTITYFINSYIISDRELHTYTMATSRKKSWREPARELYRLSGSLILMKIVPTFLDKGCHVVGTLNPTAINLSFLDLSRYFFIQVAPHLLLAGRPPHMALYESWTDCWSHLSRTNQLKRGSSMLWRYYTGPQVVIQGRAMPVNTDSFFKQL